MAVFHPTSVLETGYDILFFWVARMVIMTEYALNEVPFHQVYIHGLVLDKHGKKMSKSKEETAVDPITLIEQFGADALRLSMITGVTPGNDMRLSTEKVEGCRNFVNKLWNISRFIFDQLEKDTAPHGTSTPIALTLSDQWIITRLQTVITEVTHHIDRSEFSQASETLRMFTTDELADWYLEIAKIEGNKSSVLLLIIETLLALWHPMLPYITEVLYQHLISTGKLSHTVQTTLLMVHQWPSQLPEIHSPEAVEKQFSLIRQLVVGIRNARAEHRIPPSDKLAATFYAPYHSELIKHHELIIMRLARLNLITLQESGEKPTDAIYIKTQDVEVFLPLSGFASESEAGRLDKEIAGLTTALQGVETRLASAEFTAKAPEKIIALEREKVVTYQEKLAKLQEQRAHLS